MQFYLINQDLYGGINGVRRRILNTHSTPWDVGNIYRWRQSRIPGLVFCGGQIKVGEDYGIFNTEL